MVIKRILSSLAALLFVVITYAQGTPTVTLFHNDEYKVFYSSKGLEHAVAESVSGDIITLSPGVFQGTKIDKALTIRGAGIEKKDQNMEGASTPTIITGKYTIAIPEEDTNNLYMEGISHDNDITVADLSNAIFVKCEFEKINNERILENGSHRDSNWTNLTFIDCILTESGFPGYRSVNFYNCVVFEPINVGRNIIQDNFYNCILIFKYSYSPGISDAYAENTIIYNIAKDKMGNQNSQLFNCLIAGSFTTDVLDNNLNRGNNVLENSESPFIENTFYRLTETAKAFKANDEGEIGIYGGNHPFSIKTTHPYIKKLVVGKQTSEDGILSIELEIDTAQ